MASDRRGQTIDPGMPTGEPCDPSDQQARGAALGRHAIPAIRRKLAVTSGKNGRWVWKFIDRHGLAAKDGSHMVRSGCGDQAQIRERSGRGGAGPNRNPLARLMLDFIGENRGWTHVERMVKRYSQKPVVRNPRKIALPLGTDRSGAKGQR